jgi:hypothetical protein
MGYHFVNMVFLGISIEGLLVGCQLRRSKRGVYCLGQGGLEGPLPEPSTPPLFQPQFPRLLSLDRVQARNFSSMRFNDLLKKKSIDILLTMRALTNPQMFPRPQMPDR